MIVTDDGSQLFVGDIVEVLNDDVSSHAKVIKFMTKVKTVTLQNHDHYRNCTCGYRKEQGNF